MQPPSYYEDLARHAECRKDYVEAAKQWGCARTASVGHNRRARYEAAQTRCLALAGDKT